MIKNKKIFILSTLIGLVFVLVISVSYAWFASFKETGNMGFKILQIDSIVNLYQANDLNDNGVPDKLSTENNNKYLSMKDESDPNYNSYVSYSEYYYKEIYDFSLKDSKYALAKDSSANLLNTITLKDMAPSKIYTIKFEAINYSEFVNNMYFSFLKLDESNTISLDFLKQLKIRFAEVKNENDVLSYGFNDTWTSFLESDATSYEGITINDSSSPYTLPIHNEYMNDGKTHHGKIDFWLQIKIDDEATITNTSTFTLPQFRITFEIPNA